MTFWAAKCMKIKIGKVKHAELQKLRKLENYAFSIYDDGFKGQHHNDGMQFLCCGRDMLYEFQAMINDQLLLAKAQCANRAVLLYVDRDYYELQARDSMGVWHICTWQRASVFRDLNIEDLEFIMASCLTTEGKPPENTKRNAVVDFWEKGEEPPAIQALGAIIADNLV